MVTSLSDTVEKLLASGESRLKTVREGALRWLARIVGSRESRVAAAAADLRGAMIVFSYDPKLKKVLPYYDRYPIVIPLSADRKSMLGLNLHYLPPLERLKFVRALQTLAAETSASKRLDVSYGILKSAKRFAAFAPCVKRYLFSHFKSRLTLVEPAEWERAALLPVAKFVGAQEERVWADSMSRVRARRSVDGKKTTK